MERQWPRPLWPHPRVSRACCHILTGFPWNVLGYALTYPLPLMQSAALFGIYGLTLITVVICTLPATLYFAPRRAETGWQRHQWAIVAVVPLCMLWLYGSVRLQSVPASTTATTTGQSALDPVVRPMVRIVQPSVLQHEKWRPEHQRRIFDEHLQLSLTNPAGQSDSGAGIDLIVWPEAAMPFFPLETKIALTDLGRMIPTGTTLVSGGMRAEPRVAAVAGPGGTLGTRRAVYNSLMAFSAGESAVVRGVYDKIHLVPFGEYLPMAWILERIGLQNLSRERGGFASGAEPRSLMTIPGVGKIGPLICYEALFPGDVVHGMDRPRAFINVTNDGWFGNTTGPRQHLHMARVRAVEEGLPIVRAANNGISAMIDGNGRVMAQLGLNVRGSLDAALPPALAAPFYARFGDKLFFVISGALAFALFLRRRCK
jgi:apolipoprotein N-acyltransferase